jgi:hypothetical protein
VEGQEGGAPELI